MRRIYVIDPSGMIIGCYPPEEKAELVGSLVHALSMFSREILKMEISEVRMGHYYMLLGDARRDLKVVVISPVREKRLLERAINEIGSAFKDVEITPGLVMDDTIRLANEALKRAFEVTPPMEIAINVINYALEMPRKTPPRWIDRCRKLLKKRTIDFEEKIKRALERRAVSKHNLKEVIEKLLTRDLAGAWKAALRSGSKIAILHTSISLARVDPRIDGLFLKKYFDYIGDEKARRYIELRHRALIDMDPQYDKTTKEYTELGRELLRNAEADDEYLILYLPPTSTRPKRLEEMLPLEEKLTQDFYMRFLELSRKAETYKESYETWRKFADVYRELYTDMVKKISYKSPIYPLLASYAFQGMSIVIMNSENPKIFAREFLEKISPFIDSIVRSIKHNAWRRISIWTIVALFSSIIELTMMAEDYNIRDRIMRMLNRARNKILKTIAYTILRKRISVPVLEQLASLIPFAPLLGDHELSSILFFQHPIISQEDLEKLLADRPDCGLAISTFLHLGSLMYKKYCLGGKIGHQALDTAELALLETERRIGEEAMRMARLLLEKLVGE